MKKTITFLFKGLKYLVLGTVLLVGLIILVLSVRYSPRYVYRLVRYNVADVFDYTHFENRKIRAAEEAFDFSIVLNEDYVEKMFREPLAAMGFQRLEEWADRSQTTALIFIQRDTVLYEKYFHGFNRTSYFHSQSMAKSFLSALIGFALEDGYIESIDDPMTVYIPELAERDPRFGEISIRNLLMMQSGLKYREAFLPFVNIHAPWHDEALGYYHGNVRKLLLKRVDVDREPGKDFQYCNYNTSYLGLIIERVTGKSVSAYLEEKLWSKLMAYDALFSVDSKKSGFEYMPSRLMARAIDYARFGRLFLNGGKWEGQQILSGEWVKISTREDTAISRDIYPEWMGRGSERSYYGYQWWGHANGDSAYQFFASGNLGQTIYIIPDQEVIMVHCGNSLQYYHEDILRHVARQVRLTRPVVSWK